MNIIQEQVNHFIENTEVPIHNYRLYLSRVKDWLYEYSSEEKQYHLLTEMIFYFRRERDEEEKELKHPERSLELKQYDHLLFRLEDEAQGIKKYLSEDSFFENDKNETSAKLDEILERMQKLENGQEIIYEDLSKELNEMKDYYYLNKKTWSQLFIGKLTTMISSGIVSETVSKEIVRIIEEGSTKLINQL